MHGTYVPDRNLEAFMNKAVIVASAAMICLAVSSADARAQGTMDKIEGTATELKGVAKETFGKATGDTKLEWGGKIDKVEGAAQNAVGDLKNASGGISAKVASLFTRFGNFLAGFF
jgi:uncharacterized protein YjbJ (UPF0337 family)